MPDPSRLLARATRAFVDRSTIQWTTLLGRARGSHDRALLENLRSLAGVRDVERTRLRTPAPGLAVQIGARAVIGIASVEIAGGLALLLTAYASGVAIARLPQLLLALAFAAGAVPLALAVRHEPRSVFLLAAFASASCGFLRSAIAGLPPAWIAPFEPMLRAIGLEMLTPACLWLFALDFPKTLRLTTFDRLARGFASGLSLVSLAAFAINGLAALRLIDQEPVAFLLRDHPSHVFWQLHAVALITSIAVIFIRSVRAPADERRKVVRFASVLAAGTGPYVVAGFAWAFRSRAGGPTALPVWVDWWVVTMLTAMPLCATAAVIVDEPFNYRRLFAQRLPSLVTQGALRGIRVALVAAGLVIVIVGRAAGPRARWDWPTTIALLALVVAGLLITAHPGWLGAIERRVFRRGTDPDAQLARALNRIRVARGGREVLAVTARELQRALGVVRVRILVENDTDAYVDSTGAVMLARPTTLVGWLRDSETPLDLTGDGRLQTLLPASDRDWVTTQDVEVLAALKRRDGSIGAVVAIGRKHGGFPFDRRDHWLISSLTAAAAACSDVDVPAPRAERAPSSGAVIPAASDVAFQCVRCGLVFDATPLACGCGGEAILASLPVRVGEAFTVTRWLGSGGMGVVYLARDERLGREVALKTLPELNADAVGRLQAEARAMAALSHEALATIYGLEIWRRTPVLIVEYLTGGTLARQIARGPLSPSDTIQLGIRLAHALAYMHAGGMLHGDLKPSNIGFTATGVAKLLDFGLTRSVQPNAGDELEFLDAMSAGDRTIAGTPAYLAPEASADTLATPAFDLWALSVTLLEAVSGVNPFAPERGRVARQLADEELVAFCARHISAPPLRAFFERALATDPNRRFDSSEEAIAALADLRRG